MATRKTNDYARRLKAFRKYKKLTQVQLSEVMGVTQPAVQKWESGITDISVDVVMNLHTKLNMSLAYFFTGKGTMEHVAVKNTLLSDLASLQTENQMLKFRLEKLENDFKILFTDYYAGKHGVK